jgi:hypothetical protein
MKALKTKPAQNIEFSHISENLLKVQFDQTPVYLTEETAWEMMYEMAAFLAMLDQADYEGQDLSDPRIQESEQMVRSLNAMSSNMQRKYYS